jgi:hypothetical protein
MTCDQKDRAKKIARAAAVAGAVLAVVCQFIPPKYQDACRVVSKVASISAGGCS